MPRKTRATPSTCKVCDADALYSYYGATACLSCKMFFKRYGGNAQMPVCDFDGNCEVNTNTRHVCPACRLLKCFQVGMRSEMLRGTRAKPNSSPGSRKTVTAPPPTNSRPLNRHLGIVNLLEQDQSQLNAVQRTYLSNLIHSCDNQAALSAAKDFLKDLSNQHPRLRFKVDSTKMLALATVFYQAAETFIRANQDLASFPAHERVIVVRNAMDNVSVLLGGFLAQQSGLIADSAYRNILEQTYGAVPYRFTILSISLLDDDVNLVKLALATFALCTNDCTLFNGNIPRVYLPNNQATVRLQHVYAELTWRYLLCTCTFDQAVARFSRLVRCMCAALTVRIHLQTVNNHTDVIAPLIDELGKQHMEDLDDG